MYLYIYISIYVENRVRSQRNFDKQLDQLEIEIYLKFKQKIDTAKH